MSLRDKIKSAKYLRTVDVIVPEWGETITLKEMTGIERAQFEEDVKTESSTSKDAVNSMAMMIVRCAVDKDGNPSLSDEDVELVSSQSMGVIRKLFDEALKINALSKEDIDELEKN